MPGNEVFPTLQACQRLTFNNDQSIDNTVFDIKFYPYPTKDDVQIFAVVAANDAVILEPKLGSHDVPFEILSWFRDEQSPRACYNSVCWTKDPVTKKPLLCIAGETPTHIKLLDVHSRQPIRTLAGHGKAINDLAISPLSTNLLASASNDNTIRLWSLDERHRKQPCVALFAGEGHKSPVLGIHFHPNGCWMLSGGIDTAVCLWLVPSLAELEEHNDNTPYCNPIIVYHPHFFSKEVHPNFVDCLAFYGDIIISKAAREPEDDKNEILMWRIDGFDSEAVPPEPPVPAPTERTRSAFPHDTRFRGFRRLHSLDIPNTSRFYHRFGFLHARGMRPILAMGNEKSTYYFWDLQRIEEGVDSKDRPKPKKAPTQRSKLNASKSSSPRYDSLQPSENGRAGTPSSMTDLSTTSGTTARECNLGDPFTRQAPHFKKPIPFKLPRNQYFATSQIDFSPDGTWMVGVGDHGMICIFHRDKGVVGAAPLPQKGDVQPEGIR